VPEAVVVDGHRRRIASHHAGAATLKPIAFIAFGDGGHNPATDTAKPSPSTATALYHEVKRKPVTVFQDDTMSTTGKGTIDSQDLPVGSALSEAALFDSDGNLICWKTFSPKYLDVGETYGVSLIIRF
jgi:hypothetical protein